MATKILIVEDNSFISEDIADQLKAMQYEVTGQAFSYDDALEQLKSNQPQVVLLDINLNENKSGIDLAHYINKHYQIPFIFITSHSDTKTLQDVNATQPYGYLLKPFDENALQANIELALFKFQQNNFSALKEKLADSLFVKVKQALVKIVIRDILYAEAYDNYCYIKTPEQKYLVSQTLKSVEEKLNGHGFVRVHRGYLINVSKIESVTDGNVYVGAEPIPVGRSFKDDLINLLNTL